jgi:HSP20 family protein
MFAPARQGNEWQPAADVYRTQWGWILKFDLAGVRMEDIHVHVGVRTVTVSGVRRDYMMEEGCRYYSMEITYSRFERTIELPDDLNKAQFRLDYRDGILFVRISKDKT